jgi:short-subunit dehydrogenase
MSRRQLRGSRILVTGASSGIGRELTLRLARRGARLLVTARREDRLLTLAREVDSFGAQIVVRAGDLADSQLRQQLITDATQHFQGLDGLVNNAGAGAVGSFQQASPQRMRQLMELNFFAPVELTRLALPLLCEGRQPLVVNIGSVLGHVAVPKKSEYCASKFALRGWSDALRCELRPQGIQLLWVAPNTTRSEFFDRLLDAQGDVARNPLAMSPVHVARRIESAMRHGRSQLILTCSGRALVRLNQLMPGMLSRLLERFG